MKFLKQLSLYTLVGVLAAGINFFVMPVLSHYLSPSDYGTLSLFNSYITILIPLISLSANSLLNVEYFKGKSKDEFSRLFSSIQVIPFFTSAILAILSWQFFTQVNNEMELQNVGKNWGYIMIAIAFFTIYCDQFSVFLILGKKAGQFTLYSLFKLCIEISLTLYFVIVKGWEWEGRIYSSLITTGIFFCVSLVYFHKQGFINGVIRIQLLKEGLFFGAPLILHELGKFVVNQSDRLFIAKMVSLSEAGIYNIGYTIGSMVMIIINAFFNYYSPFLMERLSNLTDDNKLQIVKMSYLYALGCIVILVGIQLFSSLFFRWFIDGRYVTGNRYVFWVALGYCFWGTYMLFTGFVTFYKRTKVLGWLALFNIFTNLGFNYWFIGLFGAIGAAYATALSFLLLCLIVGYKANQLVALPWFSFQKIKITRLV
ncbi:lipopolysaccharide biosynthesis protein [Flavisolibacter ginsengisoli]|jgi:O-antigen/teichoic acid export membrane protein|uniref:Membrane protein involved in the export of O-antigen and teichoic acid n=1 Tax=Flavisolibacter ginsengisoli DSM 18119 TaxID=1121884 RepID=A0A1M4VH78_9BACT|nr:oligosaccharide flippase family protein [Flavisolibacter ginsengisoli]SHE68298.1 Membrane protein involved in the export of O-antigen and teichoic acid [Flavisolibacter ginsengisoli DSM 18119]